MTNWQRKIYVQVQQPAAPPPALPPGDGDLAMLSVSPVQPRALAPVMTLTANQQTTHAPTGNPATPAPTHTGSSTHTHAHLGGSAPTQAASQRPVVAFQPAPPPFLSCRPPSGSTTSGSRSCSGPTQHRHNTQRRPLRATESRRRGDAIWHRCRM